MQKIILGVYKGLFFHTTMDTDKENHEIYGGKSSIQDKFHIIGKGTYGCVVRPEIIRQNNRPGSRKFISKIQENNRISQSEISIGKDIQKISKYQLHFAPILEHSPISLSKITDSSIKDCVDTHTIGTSTTSTRTPALALVSNRMHYVGKMTFRKYFYSLLVEHTLTKPLSIPPVQLSHKHMHRYMGKLVDAHLYLLHSLTLLNRQGILHLDIKENNVMYNKENDVFIMIDFGLGVQTSTLEPSTYAKTSIHPFAILSERYWPWPIEMVMMAYIARQIIVSPTNRGVDESKFSSKIPEQNLQEMKRYSTLYLSNNRTLQMAIIDEKDRKNFETRLHTWISTFKNRTWKDMWQQVLASHKTWDHYGLTVMILGEMSNMGIIETVMEFTRQDVTKNPKTKQQTEILVETRPSVLENIIPVVGKGSPDTKKPFFSFLTKYIETMKEIILADPAKRNSPEDMSVVVKNIFRHLDKSSYRKALEQLNRSLNTKEQKKKIKDVELRETLRDISEEEELHKQANIVVVRRRQ